MITYKVCTAVDIDCIYAAFRIGFSDYMIKLEMSKEQFVKRFFGPEGNCLEYSHIAFHHDQPVGLILGGIKIYEGVKTLRCGTLCIHPDYRGKGISQQLFELHRQVALDEGCRQLFLEVIAGNHRAVAFYRKLGYEKVYDLAYFSHKEPLKFRLDQSIDYEVRPISMIILREIHKKIYDVHINWQNDFDYIAKLEDQIHYGTYHGESLAGAMSLNISGKIYFLWVDSEFRHQGLGRKLIAHASEALQLQKIAVSFPNNGNLEGFVKRVGFDRDDIAQYEMYLTL